MTRITAMDLAKRLSPRARRSGNDWWTCCPAHADKSPSLCISDKGARTMLFCKAGCDQKNILEALEQQFRIRPRDLVGEAGASSAAADAPRIDKRLIGRVYAGGRPDIPMPDAKSLVFEETRPSHVWPWRDDKGTILAITARYDLPGEKFVVPYTPWALEKAPRNVKWVQKAPPHDDLFYDVDKDDGVSPVLIVEGEKCAEAAKRVISRPSPMFGDELPWITTNLGGSRKIHRMNVDRLRNRHIYVMRDMDQPGLIYASQFVDVGSSLTLINLRHPSLKTLPNGYDIYDWEEEGLSLTDLERMARTKITMFAIW